MALAAEEETQSPVVDPPAEVAAVDPGAALEIIYWGAEGVVLLKDGVEYLLSIFDGDNGGDNIVTVDGDGGGALVSTRNIIVPEEDRPEGSLAGTMDDIFGPYQPLTYEVTTYVGDQTVTTTEIIPGLAGLDWPWLCGFGLFALCALSVFKLLGVVLK